MKTLGIIGGIGPESTIDYYRSIIKIYREQSPGGTYPSIIINSIDLKTLVGLIEANELEKVSDYLVAEFQRLAAGGAMFGILAANTPHIVFDEIRRRAPFPLISIVEATCRTAQTMGLNNLGLFGTRFTMHGSFYQSVFARSDIKIVSPNESEQAYIHERYMSELVNGIFLPETRERLLAIAVEMKMRDGIEGIILGGTELPLILRTPVEAGIAFLDTTQIHVKAAVEELLS
jgi:aspartate racemase